MVIPGTGFASADGTYTNTERRLQAVEHAIEEEVVFNNWEVAAEIAHVYEVEMPYDDEADIAEAMDCTVPVLSLIHIYRGSFPYHSAEVGGADAGYLSAGQGCRDDVGGRRCGP